MDKPFDGGPAFPFPTLHGSGAPAGMSLRDYFAAQALSGMLGGEPGGHLRPTNAAREAYEHADAMLKARGEGMSDIGDDFRALKDHKKAIRAIYGVKCPQCAIKRPKAQPTILLPQQRCRVDGYRDPRPELTDEQWGAA